MTQPTIEQMNEAIARFMGMTPVYSGKDIFGWEDISTGRMIILGTYKPNEDWNELMPVIEKISKQPLLHTDDTVCADYNDRCYPITFNMPTFDGKVMFRFKGFALHKADTLIEACFNAVYEVAKFYSQQTTQP